MSGIVRKLAEGDCLLTANYANCSEYLGPHRRFILWVQGCERNCMGCISPEMQSLTGGTALSVESLFNMIADSHKIYGTEGMTISGGEPFYQADRLCGLISRVRECFDFGVIIYTGYTLDELEKSGGEDVLRLVNMADVIVDGEYISELDDDRGMRGSSNQRVIMLSDRYRSCEDYFDSLSGRKNHIYIKDGKMQFIGIPSGATKRIINLVSDREV